MRSGWFHALLLLTTWLKTKAIGHLSHAPGSQLPREAPARFLPLLEYCRFHQMRSQSFAQTDLKPHSEASLNPARGYPEFLLLWHRSLRESPRLLQCRNEECFANAVMQVLAHSPPISYFCITRSHSKRCQRLGVCCACSLEMHISSVFSKIENDICNPQLLSKVNFSETQRTPLKFLDYLLELMHREEQNEHAGNFRSFVEETFVGRLRYQLTCAACGKKFSRRVKFRYLSLFIDSGIFDVDESLSHMFSSSSRISDVSLACPACNSTTSFMCMQLRRPPPILCLHVSRSETLSYARERKFVMFPQFLALDHLTPATGTGKKTYQLYAVVVHDKSSKHKYSLYVKNKSNSWVEITCDSSRPVSEKIVMAVKANLLFYKRAASTP